MRVELGGGPDNKSVQNQHLTVAVISLQLICPPYPMQLHAKSPEKNLIVAPFFDQQPLYMKQLHERVSQKRKDAPNETPKTTKAQSRKMSAKTPCNKRRKIEATSTRGIECCKGANQLLRIQIACIATKPFLHCDLKKYGLCAISVPNERTWSVQKLIRKLQTSHATSVLTDNISMKVQNTVCIVD